jgi:hypothetical protein
MVTSAEGKINLWVGRLWVRQNHERPEYANYQGPQESEGIQSPTLGHETI